MEKALIAMSGGVDSSVAALLIKNSGLECIGATMRLFNKYTAAESLCCTDDDIKDAALAAEKIGIEHLVFNFEDEFEKCVIEKFISDYENGLIPNPCIVCNRFMKFERLFKEAQRLGIEKIATGHYARIEKENGRFVIKKALDSTKDQSYVLYSLTQEQLSHTLFPLGNLRKSEIREYAKAAGLSNADRKDSQDICFVPDGDYVGFIKKHTGKTYPSGDFTDLSGKKLGTHKGIISYTVGQRKGLGISSSAPLYVHHKDLENNKVILSSDEELFSSRLEAINLNFMDCDAIDKPRKLKAKIRYRHTEQPATVLQIEEDKIEVVFDEPQRAITAGQSVVLYDGDTVVGGGIIISEKR